MKRRTKSNARPDCCSTAVLERALVVLLCFGVMDDQKEPLIDQTQEPADEELKEQVLEDLAGGGFGGGGRGDRPPRP
jgi:hypothetical protein